MRKMLFLFLTLFLGVSLFAQDKILIHNAGNTIYSELVNNVDSIKFSGQKTMFNTVTGVYEVQISDIDSITFASEPITTDSIIYIIYNETTVTVINPLSENGVNISVSGCDVAVNTTSGIQDLQYRLSGSTSNGSLTMSSDQRFTFVFNGVSITNPDGTAIEVTLDKKVSVVLADSTVSSLTDGSASIGKAAFHSEGQLIFSGNGTLHVTGNKKHGINSDDYIKIKSGDIHILSAVNDGIHCDYFVMEGGSLHINASGDGIDGDTGFIQIDGGNISILSTVEDTKAIKSDSIITVNGGTISLEVSGNRSKGFKSNQDITFNGGTIGILVSGSTVLEASGSGYDPSYCTAIKTYSNFVMRDGSLTIVAPETNMGGKGISADADVTIYGGTIEITTAGNGETYTNASNQTDSYTAACIKSEGVVSLLGGTITCSSSGTGGKGINTEGTLILGILNADDADLNLNVTTSGIQFLVSGGGGGWPPGSGNDYASPKAIKSEGAMTINSGTITVNCTQSSEGGECIESKSTITINGGNIYAYSQQDDCINAANNITINGGTIFCQSDNNDGIDSNGTLFINGGFTLARGARQPEEGFDCDQNQFKITGGIAIGTGGATSMPTINVCTQPSIRYSTAAGTAICIINPDNETILTFQMPTYAGGGGGGPGGGNNMVMLYTGEEITQGNGWTLKYGGTISGGTESHGFYTGATYSGGQTKTFNILGMVTNVQ